MHQQNEVSVCADGSPTAEQQGGIKITKPTKKANTRQVYKFNGSILVSDATRVCPLLKSDKNEQMLHKSVSLHFNQAITMVVKCSFKKCTFCI